MASAVITDEAVSGQRGKDLRDFVLEAKIFEEF